MAPPRRKHLQTVISARSRFASLFIVLCVSVYISASPAVLFSLPSHYKKHKQNVFVDKQAFICYIFFIHNDDKLHQYLHILMPIQYVQLAYESIKWRQRAVIQKKKNSNKKDQQNLTLLLKLAVNNHKVQMIKATVYVETNFHFTHIYIQIIVDTWES